MGDQPWCDADGEAFGPGVYVLLTGNHPFRGQGGTVECGAGEQARAIVIKIGGRKPFTVARPDSVRVMR